MMPVRATLAEASYETGAEMILLVVDKGARRAVLQTLPEDPTRAIALKDLRIATGRVDGDKQKRGDLKTPEGIYFARSHLEDNELPEKYGPKAIPIDFPNPIDKAYGKTGSGIWLHGVDSADKIEAERATEGCVAFYNADIERLSWWVRPKQGLIAIAQNSRDINRPEDVAELRRLTDDWVMSWAGRDLDRYIGYYGDRFRAGKRDRTSYKRYKKIVFGLYNETSIEYGELRVVTHPKYAVSVFNMTFRGDDKFASTGRKTLYWERNDEGRWKIRAEVFERDRFEPVTFTENDIAMLVDKTDERSEYDWAPPTSLASGAMAEAATRHTP